MHIAHSAYGLVKRRSSHGFSRSDRGEPAQQPQIDWTQDTGRPGEISYERAQAWKSLPEGGALVRGVVRL